MTGRRRQSDGLPAFDACSRSEPCRLEVAERAPKVFVVDDSATVRDALLALFESVGIDAVAHDCGERLLDTLDPGAAGCALLDVRMPGIGGLPLARELHARGIGLPIVFISAHVDVRFTVEAMRMGAEDVIEKPFREQDVLDRTQRCLQVDRERRAREREVGEVHERLDALSARERTVLEHVLHGEANQEIAAAINLSRRTIETHRAHLMHKMHARSLAELVAMVTRTRTLQRDHAATRYSPQSIA